MGSQSDPGTEGVVDRETKLRRLKCRRDQIKVESAIEPIGVVFLFAQFGLLLGVAVYILGESNGGLLISGLSALALGGVLYTHFVTIRKLTVLDSRIEDLKSDSSQ